MKNSTKIIAGILVVAIVLFVIYKMSNNDSGPGKYDDFARCLTANNVTMYGAYWCSHCQNEKKLFGGSWQYVNYVECDPQGNNANPELCREKGVSSYPTWEFPGGEVVAGEMPLREIGFRGNCTLPD